MLHNFQRQMPGHSSRRALLAQLLMALQLSITIPALAADKTDVVIFKNGDRLTGEVKELGRGKLRFNTDPTGTISIEWEDIAFLSSDQNIQTETMNGSRYFGRVTISDEAGKIVVETSRGPAVLDRDRVVSMDPIDQEGWRDVDIDVSLGYNFTNANSVEQFNVGMSARQRTRTHIMGMNFSSIISDSADSDASQRQTLGFNFSRLRANRWLTSGNLNFDTNDELGINLRTSLGGGGGRIITQSNHSFFVVQGGLKVTRENLIGEPEDKDSLESYVDVQWDWFRYDSPEWDLSTSLEIIPSITEWGRVRAELEAKLKWEIVNELYWQFEVYSSFDNQPQSEGASNNDYGVITALAYEF